MTLDEYESEDTNECQGNASNDKNEEKRITIKSSDKNTGSTNTETQKHKMNAPAFSKDAMEEFKVKILNHNASEKTKQPANENNQLSLEEKQMRIKDREERLKNLSLQMKTPEGLADLEKQPAFVRRKVMLNPVPASNESQISRFTLVESGEKKTQIKSNNSFLHDNVD